VLTHRRLCGLFVAPLLAILCAPLLAATAAPAVPPVLGRFVGFTGRLEYVGHRSDVPDAPEVRGTAEISDSGYVIEERSAHYVLRADQSGVVVRSGAAAARAADPLDADALVNPWAVAIAALARGMPTSRGGNAWQTTDGLVLYTDPAGGSVAGMTKGFRGRLAFTFTAWGDVAGLAIPTRILRLRNGISDASLQIDRLDIIRDPLKTSPQWLQTLQGRSVDSPPARAAATSADAPASPAFPWRLMLTLFGSMLLGIASIAWIRRDAFVTRLCAQRARDPRAWRATSSAAYVSADGVLQMEGNEYRVGPEFFARCVEVCHSALFVRVSAPGVTRVIVLPRRLPRLTPARQRVKRRAAAHGLSLIETLVAVAFFAVVIVGAVYPTLVAVARADLVAAQKRAGLLAAANALTDEEQACAYGLAAPTGTTTTYVNGVMVVVTVTDSPVAGARDITVSSSDASGNVLATLVTTVGPPVPAPGTGGPPTQPAPTPAPTVPQASPSPAPTDRYR
jgi:Tfp pilus assembly protein PilV